MKQVQHLEPWPTAEVHSGVQITAPGMAVDTASVIRQYSVNSVEDRVKGYYDQEGMPIPDFSKMTRIEKLVKLSEYREIVKNKTTLLDGMEAAAVKRQKDAELEKIKLQAKKEANESKSKQQESS